MLNTDRGADNYMIKYCEGDHEKSLINIAPHPSKRPQMSLMGELRHSDTAVPSQSTVTFAHTIPPSQASSSTVPNDYTRHPHIHIAAIDNSLSFPHEHPQGWRSYTYGWLYLPVSLIGRPFSEKTRQHFLPLLTSKTWWEETTFQLRKIFAIDPDFHPKMFKVSACSATHADLCHLRIVLPETTGCYQRTSLQYRRVFETRSES
jgi:phosphatidylinositol 4-kinase type 2